MKYLMAILCIFFLSGCGCGDAFNYRSKDSNASIEGKLTLTVIAHGDNNYYVTNLSDTPYYVAINIENKSNAPIKIKDIQITDNSQFIVESNPEYFPANRNICNIDMTLNTSNSCEILIKLKQASQISSTTALLNIITKNNTTYSKRLTKHPFAYIAGNFSKTYNSHPIIHSTPQLNAHCGVNQDSLCSILEYDIDNNTVVSIAKTNWNVNSIVADRNGILYIGGGFDSGFTSTQTIDGPTNIANSTLLLTLNPSNGKIGDFLKDVGQNNYPNNEIYSLAYNDDNLYVAGGFDSIANISTPNSYPLIRYNFTTQIWNNALGNNTINPDAAITALGFDKSSNLYISGIYSVLSNFTNLEPFGIFSINKCKLINGVYNCSNNPSEFTYIDSTTSYQPASSIIFDNNNNLFTAGGFSQINNTVGATNTQDYIVAKLDNLSIKTWTNITFGQSPNRSIGVVTPLNDNQGYYIGGWFSTVGGLNVDLSEAGECGLDTDQFSNGINSCMLAKYNTLTNTWNKIFSTDGLINTFSISSKLSID